MLLALFAPSIIFIDSYLFYGNIVLMYAGGVALLAPMLRKLSISDHWGRWLLYGAVAFGTIMFLAPEATIDGSQYHNWFTLFLWQFFVIAMSETYIMIGVYQKLKNPITTIIVMGCLHITAYMMAYGLTWNVELLYHILKACLGFGIFFFMWKHFRDPVLVGIVHVAYNMGLMNLG
jgi:hypothetical protein